MFESAIGIRALVSGVVQGVYFRASTKEKADQGQISGWAKNLTDGRVEVLLIGETAQVMAVKDWLHHGPDSAIVSEVAWDLLTSEDLKQYEGLADFKTL